MIKMKKAYLILFFVLFFSTPVVFGLRPNYVYDWDDLLTDEQELTINDYCSKVDGNTTAEIVVITLSDSEGRTQEEARLYYFNEYTLDGVKGIGKEGKDNGVLLILCLKDNFWGIEVGYDLEGDLTDSEAGRIGRDILVKNLKESKNFDAVFGTVEAISNEIGYGIIKTNEVEPVETTNDENIKELFQFFFYPIILVLGIILISVLLLAWRSNIESGWKQKLRETESSYRDRISDRNHTISLLEGRITELTPPIHKEVCPECGGKRNCQETGKKEIEKAIDGFYYTWLIYFLVCRGCNTKFQIETEKIKGESVKEREDRLEAEQLALLQRQQEAEERRRRRKQRDDDNHHYHHSSSYSGSSFGGSFGGGRSGGGGAGGRIR